MEEEDFLRRLETLQDSFRQVTGWDVKWHVRSKEIPSNGEEPSAEGEEITEGISFSLKPGAGRCKGSGKDSDPLLSSRGRSPQTQEAVLQLAEGVADLLGEIHRLQQTLWQREAELATGVPVVADFSDRKTLAPRLQAILRAGVEAVGADAAGVYLLDEATTCLKLRCVWGLPIQKLAAPPRPLRGALADLEALLGHAVVLDDLARMPSWQSPEKEFGAAVCTPISTETTLLGTLWVFSKQPRDFTSQQTNILEVIAGRIAAELEREVLLAETAALKPWKDHLYQLQQWHEEQADWSASCGEGWEIGLWQESGPAGWGEFFQRFAWGDEGTALVLGRVHEQGLRAVLEAVRIRSVVQAHAEHVQQPHRLLHQVDETLWTSSAGECQAAVWVGRLGRTNSTPSDQMQLQYAAAGRMSLVLVTCEGWKSLSEPSPPLAARPKPSAASTGPLGKPLESDREIPQYKNRRHRLRRGETLVIFPAVEARAEATAIRGGRGDDRLRQMEAQLAEHLRGRLDKPAPQLAELAQKFLERQDIGLLPQSLLVLKAR